MLYLRGLRVQGHLGTFQAGTGSWCVRPSRKSHHRTPELGTLKDPRGHITLAVRSWPRPWQGYMPTGSAPRCHWGPRVLFVP